MEALSGAKVRLTSEVRGRLQVELKGVVALPARTPTEGVQMLWVNLIMDIFARRWPWSQSLLQTLC